MQSKRMEKQHKIDDLPPELLSKIFEYFSFDELASSLQYVCQKWKLIICTDVSLLKKKTYHIEKDDSDSEAKEILHQFPALRCISVDKKVKPIVVKTLFTNCSNITTLNLHTCEHLEDSIVTQLLEKCTKIEILSVTCYVLSCVVQVETIRQMKNLKVLNCLHRSDCRKKDILFQLLAVGCLSLQEINFSYCSLPLETLKCFLQMKGTQLLTLSIPWISEGIAIPLTLTTDYKMSLKKLSLYSVHNTHYRPTTFISWQFYNLEHLTARALNEVTGSLLQNLFQITQLEGLKHLDISSCDVSVDSDRLVIYACNACQNLEILDLHDSPKLSDIGLSKVNMCSSLQSLDISTCVELRTEAFEYIVKCQNLQDLHLRGLNLEKLSPGLQNILALGKLRNISFRRSKNLHYIPFDKFSDHLVYLRTLNVTSCHMQNVNILKSLKQCMRHLIILGLETVNEHPC